ncbi:hypothetical protein BVG79_00986 [Ketogulonicigenium robustum]|uniref:DUF305 domain-containing protein n=1 Tax=Ketogulonicigenium robustum TaxID=92947 RepID=A0A1W6NYN9_9RHOB|nr:DUF305 domain-containing protein [Ketogulonicigenium robustum]ARO14334.1 hypothetical protein BVG79_00986 [Ketogulonicigenium robustum]
MTTLQRITGALLIGLLATPALAQTMDHSAHGNMAMEGYMAAMDTMMADMDNMPSTGNPDADFILMMIPHHQSAIDMAKVELEHGTDDETRALAQQIIDAQEKEIAEMHAMLDRMGVKAD